MRKVAVLTDFVSHDDAYSLCGVVRNQVKMLASHGYRPRLIVRQGWKAGQSHVAYPGADVVIADPGETGQNKVAITQNSSAEIDDLVVDLQAALDGMDVVLTHDIIYQPNAWKYNVAIHRIARENPDLFWLHWVHSATPFNVAQQTGEFSKEVRSPILNSRIVAMHTEEMNRKATAFGYEKNEAILIPNPYDVSRYYTGEARTILDNANAWLADFVAVYPVRLDRGKQVEVLLEIMSGLTQAGYHGVVIIVDFHSTQGDKRKYRDEMKAYAGDLGVDVYFTSDLGGEKPGYKVEHQTVMNLFDFADFFVHSSVSESDPLTIPEAMWHRNQLCLNFDLPSFRLWEQFAIMGKFSSNIDVQTGGVGSTLTEYDDRIDYMQSVGAAILHMLVTNPTAEGHRHIRLTRSLEAVWKNHLYHAIEGS